MRFSKKTRKGIRDAITKTLAEMPQGKLEKCLLVAAAARDKLDAAIKRAITRKEEK